LNQRQIRMDWQAVGPEHIDTIKDMELAQFLIGECVKFHVSGSHWAGYEGQLYIGQGFETQWRTRGRSVKQKHLFLHVSLRLANEPESKVHAIWMPMTDKYRGAVCIRDTLAAAIPDSVCMWEFTDLNPDEPKMTRIVAAKGKSAGAKGFYVDPKAYAQSREEFRQSIQRKKRFTVENFAYTVLIALAAFSAETKVETSVLPPEPSSYNDSWKRPDRHLWEQAERRELQTLINAGTFETVAYDPSMGQLLSSKWVYKLKKDEFGAFVKRKARMVVRGDMQDEDTYDSTFSPTSRAAAMRSLISFATQEDYELKHFDIQAAFVSADIDKDNVYLRCPPGYSGLVERGQCLKLNRSLYGLKQASHLYWKRLQSWMLAHGFEQVDDEGTLFKLERVDNQMLISMYVDDGLSDSWRSIMWTFTSLSLRSFGRHLLSPIKVICIIT